MATVQGVIQGIKLVSANPHGAEASGVVCSKTYLVTLSHASSTAGDFGSVSNLQTNIATHTKSGRTFTIRRAMRAHPGVDASGAAVYITGTVTAGTTAGQVDYALGGVTAAAAVGANSGCALLVSGEEA
jgi:hypothetical protein